MQKNEDDHIGKQDDKSGSSLFLIVGIGASAGGLEAFTQLLHALPVDTGMAFVLVQHLAPSHPSALAEILSRATEMPVIESRDGLRVEPNHVYVIPPDRSMTIDYRTLQLQPREVRGVHHPIDQFFRSLAEGHGHLAVGVVLSGTASDGTLGLEAIKGEGGITFAQDTSAQHHGMPQSAVASGCVDFVLPPHEIAKELARMAQLPSALLVDESLGEKNKPNLYQLLNLLHQMTGVDFTDYKFNTLYRRISRRMLFQKMDKLSEYVRFLKQTPSEVEALYQDILINVTSFFRDAESFEALKTQVFPRLLQDRGRKEPVRLWTLGCSTGQEAYSLAIAFIEATEATGRSVPFQLFATDLNAAGIVKARAGIYPKDIAQDVSPTRLRRHFDEVDGNFRIRKTIRDACVFSRHNVISDPPFSRIDLISCRNLLIYLEPVLQEIVIPTLHYSLNPDGCLWLGGSETIGGHRDLFESQDIKHKIFSKKLNSKNGLVHIPTNYRRLSPTPFADIATKREGGAELNKEADRLLLRKFAPPGVIVSSQFEILQFRGDTSPYLTPPPGKASFNLLKMLRDGLMVSVREALLRAVKEKVTVRQDDIHVKNETGVRVISIEIIPIKDGGSKESGFLILFEDQSSKKTEQNTRPDDDPCASTNISRISDVTASAIKQENERLEHELVSTRDYLQSMIEQQESVNEELQSANEEIQSANEELQSTNEELETSKEEIQSTNEELATVNDELNNRNTELNHLNNDLVNLFASIQTPLILVGADLRIRRFTPAAERLLNLLPTDRGRLLTDINLNLQNLPPLEPLLADVLDTVAARECEVRDKDGRWYLLRLRPYRTLDNRIDGVVIILVDVDLIKRSHAYTESIVATVREPLVVLDANLHVCSGSDSFYQTYFLQPEETVGKLFYELDNGQWNNPELRRVLEEILPQNNEVLDFEIELNLNKIGPRTTLLNARRLIQVKEHDPLILLAIEDVTEHKRQAQQLQNFASELAAADHRKNEFLAMLAHELRNPLAPIRNALGVLRSSAKPQEGSGEDDAMLSACNIMDRQLRHMVRLVDDLLDVSRISQGKIQLRRERVELSSIIYHSIEASRPAMRSAQQEITIKLPQQPIYLDADATRLAQIIGNLLSNACKFTPEGGSIWLYVERQANQALIGVRDSGIGLTAEQIHRIFDLFVQVDTTLERSVSGLGIGLTLVKTLVELHGGNIEVRSGGLGHGSEFLVRLPLLRDSSGISTVSATVEPRTLTSLRILVVDDNRDSASTLSMLLKLSGHDTRVAFDGVEALETAEKFRPEVMLLDIGLPLLNGYEACRRIREEPWGQGIILIALTGWGKDEDREKSKDAGFDAHLVKPVEFATLKNLLSTLLPETFM